MNWKSRRDFLLAAGPGAAALSMAVGIPAHGDAASTASRVIDVTDFGAVGDGRSHSAASFQQAIDAAEARGGGVVHIPPGEFLLEKTPLIASRVHLMGSGPGTVLRGLRPDDNPGAALISNKGQQEPEYGGAHDWSISHLAINSPHSNGIVVTHADRVYIGFIHGIDVYHHFVDVVGRHVLCENLFLTGRSGTSSFQIDSVSGAQTIWDGEKAVAPLRDGTDAQNLILRNSIITATSGHTEHRDMHNVSVHFHGDESHGFIFSDLVLGGAETGIYQDANTAYHDIQITNVRSTNPGRAVWLCPGKTRQRNLMIRGLNHRPQPIDDAPRSYRGMEIFGRDGLLLSDTQLWGEDLPTCECALDITASRHVSITGVQARGQGGRGVWLRDHGAYPDAPVEQALIQGCLLQGFDIGCEYEGAHEQEIVAAANVFSQVNVEYSGMNQQVGLSDRKWIE